MIAEAAITIGSLATLGVDPCHAFFHRMLHQLESVPAILTPKAAATMPVGQWHRVQIPKKKIWPLGECMGGV